MLLARPPCPDGGASGSTPSDVTRIVIGHGHWDHAGQLSSFPNATLYVQKEELKQIDFFLNYPIDFNGWAHPRREHRRSDHRASRLGRRSRPA